MAFCTARNRLEMSAGWISNGAAAKGIRFSYFTRINDKSLLFQVPVKFLKRPGGIGRTEKIRNNR